MKLMSTGAGAALVLGLLTLSACAGATKAPVKTTPSSSTPHATAPSAAPAPAAGTKTEAPSPAGVEPPAPPAPFEQEPDEVAANPGEEPEDVQPAEEVEPSPLDEIPGEVPPASDAELQREKEIVAEAPVGYDIPMVLNDRVAAYVDYFTSRGRDFLEGSLDRSNKYVTAFQGVFEEAGIPRDLVYMAHVESAYKTHAYSRARAKGLWQFIVGTGTRYGLRRDWWIDERSDPELATRAAAAYLKDLHAMFGDWYLAMAGYNAGEGKIQRAIDRTGYTDFWSIARTSHIRLETKNYVPAILAAVVISKDPEKFGFSLEKEPRVEYDSVAIDSATDLGVVAKLVGSDVDTIRDLNPALARLMTPPGYPDFEVHLPSGTGARFAEQFASIPVSQRIPWRTHTVQRGETLAAISRRYGVSTAQIRQANSLGQGQALQSGAALQIPTYIAPPSIGHGDITRASSSRGNGSGSGSSGRVVYKVRRGDTLSSIASRYRVSVDQLRSLNGLGPRGTIQVGERLVVSSRKSSSGGGSSTGAKSASKGSVSRSAAAASGTTRYKVRQGDTLFRIAKSLSTTVERICDLNNLSAGDPLVPGRVLKIAR